MMIAPTFTVWLSEQRHRQDAIGDLARFAAPYHPDWPTIASKPATYERALVRRGAGLDRIAALHLAWAEYEPHPKEAA
jgi:hypothetical protein